MKKIKLLVAPNLKMKVYVSKQMEEDLKQCKVMSTLPGTGMDCKTCSWNDVKVGNIGICELSVVQEKLIEEGSCK